MCLVLKVFHQQLNLWAFYAHLLCCFFYAIEERFIRQMYETNDKPTCLTIYSQYLAGMLMQKGFVLVEMGESRKDSGRHVFFFKDTARIREEISRFKNREYKHNNITKNY